MSAASERDLNSLRKEYNIGNIPESLPASFHRALYAASKIYDVEFRKDKDALFPRLYFVSFPNRDGEVYIVHNGVAYSRGITDIKGENPVFSVDQLQAIGEDKTLEVLGHVLEVLNDDAEDEFEFMLVGDALGWDEEAYSILLLGATRMLEWHDQQN